MLLVSILFKYLAFHARSINRARSARSDDGVAPYNYMRSIILKRNYKRARIFRPSKATKKRNAKCVPFYLFAFCGSGGFLFSLALRSFLFSLIAHQLIKMLLRG